MKNISLFLNTSVGLEVARFLIRDTSVNIESVFLCGNYPLIDTEISSLFIGSNTKVYRPEELDKLDAIFNKYNSISHLICVYWPYLLKKNIFQRAIQTVNFHPAYLPINRGWYPHVHSILDGSPAGVTLHEINEFADQGAILAQKKISIPSSFCAGELYQLLQSEMLSIFVKNWSKIRDYKIIKTEQNESLSNYHKKNEIKELDFINIKKPEYKELINILRARSFGNKGFAYFLDKDGSKIFVNIKLNKA